MATTNQLSWTFPNRAAFFLRIERYYISILALFIFIYFYFGTTQFIMALLYTVLFLGIYVLTSYLVSFLRSPSDEYQVTKTHIHIHRKTKRSSKEHKIALGDINHHKIDHFFRGGYVVLKNGTKHVLFFNSEDESKMFAAWVQEHSKPRSVKKVSKPASRKSPATKKVASKRKVSSKQKTATRKSSKKRKR